MPLSFADPLAALAVEPEEPHVHLRLLAVARAVLLFFCAALVVISGSLAPYLSGLLGLSAFAVAASIPLTPVTARRLQPLVEGLVSGLLVTGAHGLLTPLLPYLIAPPLAAGLVFGLRMSLASSVLAAAGSLTVFSVTSGGRSFESFVATSSQWAFTMVAVGLLSAWVRRIQITERPAAAENASYASAYRLIAQLRVVARQLSSGLDTVTLAQSLLQALQRTLGFDRGALYVRSPGGVLVPLAFEGDAQVKWPVSTEPEGLFDEAWTSEEPRQRDGGFDGAPGRWSAAIPLRVGLRTFGVVGIESDLGPLDGKELRTAMELSQEGALRLETALLFEEVRSIATAEERRRLAREIHDGIAQELASLGYLVDDLSFRADSLPDVAEDLRQLRAQLTQMISELRLSIFDLRSEVQPSVGLGTALSEYVRQVGASSQLTVHLLLDEAPERLRVETETELLRVAQEAITNARKHAGARNLWVTCRVDPPSALLRIEDDGIGLGSGRIDSFGIDIMRERAERIGGRLLVRDRAEGGTLVEVTVPRPVRSPPGQPLPRGPSR
jgi:signal transduction histidine kinase